MRFRTLGLTRFGHFSDQCFDFGTATDRPDFHIIYGPNEAGKTTTMEGALRLLYGFKPKKEPYDFRHQRAHLRIDASLEIDGAVHSVTRLSNPRAPLVDAHGTPLPEATLARPLGGLTLDDYRKLLCLDDATLEKGGEEIANARGDIGTLLFSAAAGIADLSVMLDEVRKEADGIWKKQTPSSRLYELKNQIKALDDDVRRHEVLAKDWKILRKAVTEAQAREAQAHEHRRSLSARMGRLASQRRALPMHAELTRLEAEIAQFPDCPAQLGFDPESLLALMTGDQQHASDIARLDEARTQDRATLAGIDHAPLPPGFAQALAALAPAVTRDLQADGQILHLRTQAQEAHATIMRLTAEHGLDPAIIAHLDLPEADMMDRLGRTRDALRDAHAALPDAMRAVSLGEAQCAQPAADSGPPAPDLGTILSRHDAKGLAALYPQARTALRDAERQYRAALADLARPGQDFASLPPCPHTHTQSRALAEKAADLAKEQRSLRDQTDALEAEIATRASRATHLTTTHTLIADAHAATLRETRDRLWQAHLSALTPQTAQDYHVAACACDQAGETRLTQAETLGQLRAIELAQGDARAMVGQFAIRQTRLDAQLAEVQRSLVEATTLAGISPDILPAEWAEWVARHDKAAQSHRTLTDTAAEHRRTLDRAETLRRALAEALPDHMAEFETLLAEAHRRAQAQTQQNDSLQQARATLATRQQAVRQAEQAWRDALAALPALSAHAATWLASLKPLQDLLDAIAQSRAADAGCATIAAERAQFQRDVARLCQQAGLPPATPLEALRAHVEAALQAEQRRTALTTEIDDATQALQHHEDQRTAIAQRVALLGRVFSAETPVATIAELRAAALRAQTTITARDAHARQTQALLHELALPDLEAARVHLAGLDPDALKADITAIEAELEAANTACTQATEARVTAVQALGKVTGGPEVATLHERRATLELELEDAARRHLELHLGHLAASEAILRYRNTHRSGMMQATERSFVTLTNGAYQALDTQVAGTQETLLARDAAGTVKQVDSLSKGTRFQLYLALRAAAYEQLVAQGLRLPFFCDDIFETFDENRTRAACRVMEQIGRSGQAIYLTHHRHVVEIARAVCDMPPIVHEIGA